MILPNERLAPAGIIGFVLGLVGVIAVVQPSGATLGGEMMVGVGLVFASAIAFALGSVFLKPISSSLPLETLEAWAMLLGAGVLLGWAALRGESVAAIAVTTEAVLSFAYLTLVSGVFAFLLYFELLERTGATQVNLVSYAEPAVAMAVSWAVMGYVVDSLTVLGLLTILAGFVVIKRAALRGLLRSTLERRSTRPVDHDSIGGESGARTDGGVALESDAESALEADPGPTTNSAEPADD